MSSALSRSVASIWVNRAYFCQHLRDMLVGSEGSLAQDSFDLHEVQRLAGDQLVSQPLDQQFFVGEQPLAAVELFEDDLGLLLVRELREERVPCRFFR